MIDTSVSVVIPIHNQEKLIPYVLKSLYDNCSKNVKEILLIIDGCTDGTEEIVKNHWINKYIPTKYKVTDDIWEVKSCNVGYKYAESEYILDIQADMIIKEKDFDKRLLKPFFYFDNMLAVSGRDAADVVINGEEIKFINLAGRDRNPNRDILSQRMIVNRGPILINHEKISAIGYLDESFAPITQDDTDFCLTGLEKGWITGSYIIDYASELWWGSTRTSSAQEDYVDFIQKRNYKTIISKHRNILENPPEGKDYFLQ